MLLNTSQQCDIWGIFGAPLTLNNSLKHLGAWASQFSIRPVKDNNLRIVHLSIRKLNAARLVSVME